MCFANGEKFRRFIYTFTIYLYKHFSKLQKYLHKSPISWNISLWKLFMPIAEYWKRMTFSGKYIIILMYKRIVK